MNLCSSCGFFAYVFGKGGDPGGQAFDRIRKACGGGGFPSAALPRSGLLLFRLRLVEVIVVIGVLITGFAAFAVLGAVAELADQSVAEDIVIVLVVIKVVVSGRGVVIERFLPVFVFGGGGAPRFGCRTVVLLVLEE